MTTPIISRQEAKAKGAKRYFTGKPCVNGHVSERHIGGTCVACQVEHSVAAKADGRAAKWRENGRDAKREQDRAYQAENAERIAARKRQLYAQRVAGVKAAKSQQSQIAAEELGLTLITRRDAKLLGLTRYFTGQPCANGHIAERTTQGCCVACKAIEKKEWVQRNPDKVKAQKARTYSRHSTRLLAEMAAQYASDPTRVKARVKAWRLANPTAHRANSTLFRAKRRNAVPSWFGEFDEFAFREAFDLAQRRERAFGFAWHVDHMIPVAARSACGLHCAENIAVIPAVVNGSKLNKMIYTETGSWIQAV